MPHLVFVFLDGVGLGPATEANPLANRWPALEALAGGQAWTDALTPRTEPRHVVRSIDATLGVEGLPQSGTGQATLLTGVNCAEVVGRHFGPFPHSATHDVLATENVFRKVQALRPDEAAPAAFANAYPPRFFEAAQQRGRWTVTTRCCIEAGVEVRDDNALQAGRALAADLTGTAWRDMLDLPVEVVPVARAARRLAALQRAHGFTLFEYFLTDKAGHGRLDVPPTEIVETVDAFLGALVEDLDPAEDTLLVTSDHGNLEDLARKTHTRHPVPLLAYGWAAPYFADVTDLTGVTPAIIRALQEGHEMPQKE